MFFFLGQIFALSIVGGQKLGHQLRLPPLFWKRLVNFEVTLADLKDVDVLILKRMESITSADEIEFEDIADGVTFVTELPGGFVQQLRPNGDRIKVTFQNRQQYAQAVLSAHLNQASLQIQQIRKGLVSVIPVTVFSLFDWSQLQFAICGTPEIDIDLLERTAHLYGYSREEDPQINWLFELLREYSSEDRILFMRFISGQDTLPEENTPAWHAVEIAKLEIEDGQTVFPRAATCSCELYLPDYPSKEIMHERLIYAIRNCVNAIDADMDNAEDLEEIALDANF